MHDICPTILKLKIVMIFMFHSRWPDSRLHVEHITIIQKLSMSKLLKCSMQLLILFKVKTFLRFNLLLAFSYNLNQVRNFNNFYNLNNLNLWFKDF